MSRETVDAKAARLLIGGRLTVTLVDEQRVRATCDGDTGRYDVTLDAGMWSCSCPARGHCSHIAAARLVTKRETPGGPGVSLGDRLAGELSPQGGLRPRSEAA